MINQSQLEQMSRIIVTQTNRSTLVDINSIHIDNSLPVTEKFEDYLKQLNNPYCFLCGNIPVKIRFVSEHRSLKQSLLNYFSNLK